MGLNDPHLVLRPHSAVRSLNSFLRMLSPPGGELFATLCAHSRGESLQYLWLRGMVKKCG